MFRHREADSTGSQADNGPQAVPFPHDDGGQDLAPQEAVLDACRQRVETLVTQHGDLVMQSAASNRKLKRGKKICIYRRLALQLLLVPQKRVN